MEYYSAIKKKEIVSFAGNHMALETIINKRDQTQNHKYCRFCPLHIQNPDFLSTDMKIERGLSEARQDQQKKWWGGDAVKVVKHAVLRSHDRTCPLVQIANSHKKYNVVLQSYCNKASQPRWILQTRKFS